MFKLWHAVAAVLLSTSLLFAQAPTPAQTPMTTLRANSRLVVVDVVVTDKDGRVMKGLNASEFSVLEDGKPQSIAGFEEHTPASSKQPLTTPAQLRPGQYSNAVAESGDKPVNILLLDSLNSSWIHQADARKRIFQFLKTMPPGQRVAMFTLGTQLRMLQTFTASSDDLLRALQDFRPVTGSPVRTQDDIDKDLNLLEEWVESGKISGDVLARMARVLGEENEAAVSDRVRITLNAFRQIARATGAYPGRKNLIWVSAAFPQLFTPRDFSSTTGHTFQPGTRSYGNEIQETAYLLAANKLAVYPVDIRGLLPADPDASAKLPLGRDYGGFIERSSDALSEPQATMREVASLTGGRAYFNKNDLGIAIANAIDMGSSYYTVSYAPSNHTWNGNFRQITVKLAQKNAKPMYRRGYYAFDVDASPAPQVLEHDVQSAMVRESPLSNGVVFKASVANSGADGKVVVQYELDGHQLRLHNSDGLPVAGQLAFAIVAWNKKGKMVGQTSEFWELPGSLETVTKMEQEGWTHRQGINVPPDATRVRVAVQDRLSGKIGTVDIPLAATP